MSTSFGEIAAVEATDAAAIIAIARVAVAPVEVDPAKIYTVVAGDRVVAADLERYLPAPRRMAGRYSPATVPAFVAYTIRFASDASTTIWVHPTSGRIVAVIDDHDAGGPAWREHTVETRLQQTPEWIHWARLDGHMVSQVDFAEHIETGLDEIVDPDAATMLEVAQTFHAHTTAAFRSSNRLQSGEQRLQYDEEIKASAGHAGEILVPATLTLAIAPFIGETASTITARLRFRVNSGTLVLGYRLERPDQVIREALDAIVTRLEAQFGNVYLGDPPA